MNRIHIIFSIVCIIMLSSCSNNDLSVEIPCDGECLFTLTDIEGTMIKMNCFDRFGIKIANPTDSDFEFIFAIPDNLEKRFEVQNKKVVVRGVCRLNTLEPEFPDPEFDMNTLFQTKLLDLKDAL